MEAEFPSGSVFQFWLHLLIFPRCFGGSGFGKHLLVSHLDFWIGDSINPGDFFRLKPGRSLLFLIFGSILSGMAPWLLLGAICGEMMIWLALQLCQVIRRRTVTREGEGRSKCGEEAKMNGQMDTKDEGSRNQWENPFSIAFMYYTFISTPLTYLWAQHEQ